MIWNYKDPSENADGFRLKTNLSKCLIACLEYFYVIHRASTFSLLAMAGQAIQLVILFCSQSFKKWNNNDKKSWLWYMKISIL